MFRDKLCTLQSPKTKEHNGSFGGMKAKMQTTQGLFVIGDCIVYLENQRNILCPFELLED